MEPEPDFFLSKPEPFKMHQLKVHIQDAVAVFFSTILIILVKL